MDFLTTVLVALFGALGLGAYRYHSKALSKARSRSEALAEVVRMNRKRATEDHTKTMEVLDAKEQELQDADSHGLADTLDAVFGGGVPVSEDDAGEDGSGGAM